MKKECDLLIKMETWEFALILKDNKRIRCKWVFCTKKECIEKKSRAIKQG